MNEHIFERSEKKYVLTKRQVERLMTNVLPHIIKDKYSDYTICNIYFDTDDFQLIRSSIEKPPYKEKLRIRSYGTPCGDDTIFIELKKKYLRTVFKRRINCSLATLHRFINDADALPDNSQIAQEIAYFMRYYEPVAKLYLAYDRQAWKGVCEEDLRITFDSDIRYREDDLYLEHGDYGQPYFKQPLTLMEIKVNAAMPLWLTHALNELKLYPTSFSKYGNIYTSDLIAHTRRNMHHV